LPLTGPRKRIHQAPLHLLRIERNGKILFYLRRQPPLAGFWELPEALQLPLARRQGVLRRFRHSIMNHNYLVTVERATIERAPKGMRWLSIGQRETLPLTTLTRKALRLRGGNDVFESG